MAQKDEVGRRGEELAAHLLHQKGLIVVARNFRCPEGEIDLVCRQRRWLLFVTRLYVFVEVKTRSALAGQHPIEAVDQQRRRRIIRAAQRYLARAKAPPNARQRFDIVTVQQDETGALHAEHFADAFDPAEFADERLL